MSKVWVIFKLTEEYLFTHPPFFDKYSLSSYDDSDTVWGARNIS